jgi:hypothetical protein
MGLTKYGSGDGRILRDKKTDSEWTDQDKDELAAEQSDADEDGSED